MVRGIDQCLRAPPTTLPDGRYPHWDELRYREPPDGLSPAEWWNELRMARANQAQAIEAMSTCYGKPLSIVLLPSLQRDLHAFDRANLSDKILGALGNADAKVEYRVRQLIEESISSSGIEGARPTTRELARQMLRERRAPTSRDERMIVNNLRAMERFRELHATGTQLTLEHFLELHRILGEDALEVDGVTGVLRGPEHEVTVSDHEGNVWHVPPDAHGIEQRVEELLRFANGVDSPSSKASG